MSQAVSQQIESRFRESFGNSAALYERAVGLFPSGVTHDLYAVLALSGQEAYAVGAEGTIIRSTDGGETWEQEHTDISNNLYGIARAKDDDTLWVVGQWGVVLRRKIDGVKTSMR